MPKPKRTLMEKYPDDWMDHLDELTHDEIIDLFFPDAGDEWEAAAEFAANNPDTYMVGDEAES